MAPVSSGGNQQDWFRFAGLSGEEGRLWEEEYSRSGAIELTREINSALGLLRRRHLERARALLEQSRLRLAALPDSPASLLHVLWRWYLSALAYERYCSEALDEAGELLWEADREVSRAIEQDSFLVPLAAHCYDFRLQHARIARNRRRWEEVEGHVRTGRDMIENRQPLCVLNDGSPVHISDIDDFYRSLRPVSEEDRSALSMLLDTERRRSLFEAFVKDIYVIPGFIIPYP